MCYAGPASDQHWFNASHFLGCESGSAYCWWRVQADTDPMSVKYWASITGAGQYPFSPRQYFMLVGLRAHGIHHPQCCLNVGQRRTQWPGIGLMHVTPLQCTEQTKVNQHAPTSRQPNACSTLVHHPALAINHSTLDSASCWRWCVHRVQADTDPMSVKCWSSFAGAGQYPCSPSRYFILAVLARFS